MSVSNSDKRLNERSYDFCAYRGCVNGKYTTNSRLYRFPKESDPRLGAWIANAGNKRLQVLAPASLRNSGLCEQHFEPNCFVGEGRRLVRNAIPKLFTETPSASVTKQILPTADEADEPMDLDEDSAMPSTTTYPEPERSIVSDIFGSDSSNDGQNCDTAVPTITVVSSNTDAAASTHAAANTFAVAITDVIASIDAAAESSASASTGSAAASVATAASTSAYASTGAAAETAAAMNTAATADDADAAESTAAAEGDCALADITEYEWTSSCADAIASANTSTSESIGSAANNDDAFANNSTWGSDASAANNDDAFANNSTCGSIASAAKNDVAAAVTPASVTTAKIADLSRSPIVGEYKKVKIVFSKSNDENCTVMKLARLIQSPAVPSVIPTVEVKQATIMPRKSPTTKPSGVQAQPKTSGVRARPKTSGSRNSPMTAEEMVAHLETEVERLKQSCATLTQQGIDYRRTIRLLRRKHKHVKTRNDELRSKIKGESIDEFLDRHKCVEPAARAMVKLQLHHRKAPYTEEQRVLAKQLYNFSASAYTCLRYAGCTLPSCSSVHTWLTEDAVGDEK